MLYVKTWIDKTVDNEGREHYITSITYFGTPKRERKFSKLREFLCNQYLTDFPEKIAVMGPGSDLEISLLVDVLADRVANLSIFCFDISYQILLNIKSLSYKGFKPTLICADAINIPSCACKFDFIVSSSLQHEIFSYRGGVKGIRNSLNEFSRILKPGGVLFIRDFSTPPRGTCSINFKSNFAKNFWDDYIIYFRKAYGEKLKYRLAGESIILTSYAATDFVNHMAVKILYDGRYNDIATWKEINEKYINISPRWYVQELRKHSKMKLVANSVDIETEQQEVVNQNLEIFMCSEKVQPTCSRFNLFFKKEV